MTFTDATGKIDLYNFKPDFARFRAILKNPGLCTDSAVTTTDYNNAKLVVINLRDMTIERCDSATYVGCGNGVVDSNMNE